MGGQAKGKKHGKARRRRPERTGGNDLSGLPAEERMKMKMQNRAKKKTAEKYTVHQLLEKTEEYLDNFNYEMAQLFCQRALDMDPTNLDILDMMGSICMELGHAEKAKQVFLKTVELSPDKGHAKYMYLGQIHCKEEALHYFNKGIEVMLGAYQSQTASAKAAGFPDEMEVTTKDIAAAFCSVAEIYFTDLCMEEAASERCKGAIQKALEYDPTNSEALQLMASYLFSMDQPQEGKENLMKSLTSWLPSLQKKEAEMQGDGTEELAEPALPPYESRITTAKLLTEAEEFELASEVLEALLEEDDEVVQVWYLLGWVFYLQAKAPDEDEAFKDSARTYLRKAKKLYLKLKSDDSELMEHVEQLLSELGGEEGLEDSDAEDDALEDVEDDFLESSEDEAMES
ncbi:probable assembly chaperone of rpl4 [Xenopus laevis]|uniref:Probable assembly chaperone of rpl4 n=1 Tax=Xenopus laevis TaxID=8355 RepID=A0A8J0VNK4_XENLA|nr:probable assembly chaperone of rpl4 [Xenopus laevis]